MIFQQVISRQLSPLPRQPPQLQRLDEKEPAAREVRKLVGEHLPDLVNGYKSIPENLKRQDNKGKTPEEIRKTFNIRNDFTPEEEEEVRRENQWAFE